MKDEIKEIKLLNDIANGNYKEVISKEAKNLLDYITNLQEENKRLQLELSGYRAAILKDDKMLGLQDRIKELEQINKEHRELNGDLRTANNTLCEVEDFMYNQAKDCKTRIGKAIEYINEYQEVLKEHNGDWINYKDGFKPYLLNILQGKSDE